MYKRILVAVDGSQSSDLAIDQAIVLSKATGADIKALFVADDSELFFEPSYVDPHHFLKDIQAYGDKSLATTARRFEEAGILNATTELIERPVSPGQISDTIVSQAEKWKADLIVMGTHGRRGLRRLVMGSVSEGVIRKTGLPVLLIRCDTEK